MIIWEQAPTGYIECIVNDCYGVVGLAHPRTGWSARLDGPCGRSTAPMLFHTAVEAKAWVEVQLEGCTELTAQPAIAYRSAPAAPANRPAWLIARSVMPRTVLLGAWARTLARAVGRTLATYQSWNATYLDPRQYGRQPLCYASAQQVQLTKRPR